MLSKNYLKNRTVCLCVDYLVRSLSYKLKLCVSICALMYFGSYY